MKGAFTPEFTPVARPGQTVMLDVGLNEQAVEIERMAPLPTIETQEFSIGANSNSDKIAVEALETDDGWFAQYRPVALTQELPDGVSFRVFQSAKSNRNYTNRNQTGDIDNETPYELVDASTGEEVRDLTHLLELYVREDDDLYFQFTNTNDTVATFSLTYAGFNFDASPVSNPQDTPVYVPTTAVQGGVNTA